MYAKLFSGKILALITDQVNQESLDTIDFLQEEIRILKRRQTKRIVFIDEERRSLAVKVKKLGNCSTDYDSKRYRSFSQT